jgi:hypothetical protein
MRYFIESKVCGLGCFLDKNNKEIPTFQHTVMVDYGDDSLAEMVANHIEITKYPGPSPKLQDILANLE